MAEYVCKICKGEFTDNTRPENPICDDCKFEMKREEDEAPQ